MHICAVHDGVEVANRPKYRGLLHATSAIVREDGMRGLFRVLFKMIIKCHVHNIIIILFLIKLFMSIREPVQMWLVLDHPGDSIFSCM